MLILEKSHKKFKRDCNNLYIEKEILLSEALCKTQFIIEHMDGRKIFIEHDDIVQGYLPAGSIILLGSMVQTHWLKKGDEVRTIVSEIGESRVKFI